MADATGGTEKPERVAFDRGLKLAFHDVRSAPKRACSPAASWTTRPASPLQLWLGIDMAGIRNDPGCGASTKEKAGCPRRAIPCDKGASTQGLKSIRCTWIGLRRRRRARAPNPSSWYMARVTRVPLPRDAGRTARLGRRFRGRRAYRLRSGL